MTTAAEYPGLPRAGDGITIGECPTRGRRLHLGVEYIRAHTDSRDHTDAEADSQRHTHIFHAGTVLADGALRTCGGRVFSVAARGKTLKEAVQRAHWGVEAISFDGMFYRRDIASEAL